MKRKMLASIQHRMDLFCRLASSVLDQDIRSRPDDYADVAFVDSMSWCSSVYVLGSQKSGGCLDLHRAAHVSSLEYLQSRERVSISLD